MSNFLDEFDPLAERPAARSASVATVAAPPQSQSRQRGVSQQLTQPNASNGFAQQQYPQQQQYQHLYGQHPQQYPQHQHQPQPQQGYHPQSYAQYHQQPYAMAPYGAHQQFNPYPQQQYQQDLPPQLRKQPSLPAAPPAASTAVVPTTASQQPRKMQPTAESESDESGSDESESDDALEESDDEETTRRTPKPAAKSNGSSPARRSTDGAAVNSTSANRRTPTSSSKPFTEYTADDKCSVQGCVQKRTATGKCPIHSRSGGLTPAKGKKADAWHFELSKTNTSMGMNKNALVWKVVDRGQEFEVELFHSTLGGKRTIRINGQTKVQEKKPMDNGSRYNFMVGKDRRTALSVEIRAAGMLGHTYELFVNGRPYDEARKFWLFNETA